MLPIILLKYIVKVIILLSNFDIIYQYVYGTWLFGNGNNYPLYDKNDYHFVEVYYEDFF